jgi:hypothetical protein
MPRPTMNQPPATSAAEGGPHPGWRPGEHSSQRVVSTHPMPRATMARISPKAPTKSIDDVTMGTP